MLRTTLQAVRPRVSQQVAALSSEAKPVIGGQAYDVTQHDRDAHYPRIGNRDVVGFGWNNRPQYADRPEYPYPAIRYGENSTALAALREKEKGDWKNLSIDEKKQLYRASFRQTFAEFTAPTGEWKFVVASFLGLFGVTLWGFWAIKKFGMLFKKKWLSSFLNI